MTEFIQNQNSLRSFGAFAKDIKIGHSVFAIPFACAAFYIGQLAVPKISQIVVLLLCMVSARSFAMGMNRLLDAKIDEANPRTKDRMIPSGKLSIQDSLVWTGFSGIVFTLAAFSLSALAGWLSIPLLLILAFYPRMKKVSWITHWYLGACLGFAPWGVEIALTGNLSTPTFWLGVAVCFWTAGFDILYSLQDARFDKENGLKSIPTAIGPYGALMASRFCFGVMVTILLIIGEMTYVGMYYYIGVGIVAVILAFEHFLVFDARFDGHSKYIGAAFFNANAAVSIVYLAFLVIDNLVSH